MRSPAIFAAVLALAAAAPAGPSTQPGASQIGDDALSADRILALMRRVNDYTAAHPYIPEDRNWIRATYYTGVMSFYRASQEGEVLQQIVDYCDRQNYAEGDHDEPVNKLTIGQTYLELFFLQPDPAKIARTRAYADKLIAERDQMSKQWYYCDTLYVGPPTLALLSQATADPKYVEYMHAAFWDTHARLFDRQAGLFYRDARFIGKKSPNGGKVIWARGNGWVMGGIVRVLQYLPKDDPLRPRYVELLRTMAGAVARAQQADGLWRSNLDDPAHFPNPESSGTAFFTYALGWGVNNGVLDRDKYVPVIHKAWKGLAGCVDDQGRLGWVQPVGEDPRSAGPDSTHEYAAGLFLLAGEEMIRLERSTGMKPVDR